ncbi:MAG: hypothetical protein MZV70_65855 [Desulfobacterales bacterium]|nr:hypothetical protein [Desulfobacterales bacterium]
MLLRTSRYSSDLRTASSSSPMPAHAPSRSRRSRTPWAACLSIVRPSSSPSISLVRLSWASRTFLFSFPLSKRAMISWADRSAGRSAAPYGTPLRQVLNVRRKTGGILLHVVDPHPVAPEFRHFAEGATEALKALLQPLRCCCQDEGPGQ